LDDRDDAPGERGVRGNWHTAGRHDPRVARAGPLRVVIDHLRAEWLPAELDVGMDAKIVEPRLVLRQP
jgi:hypothetical protein